MDAKDSGNRKKSKNVDLIGFFFHVLERLWLVGLAAVLFAAGAWIYGQQRLPLYEATSKLYIVGSNDAGVSYNDLQIGAVQIIDYQEIFRTWEVHEMVREDLGLQAPYEALQSMIRIENPEDTRILYITATSANPEQAADLANAYARAAKRFIVKNMHGDEPVSFSSAIVPTFSVSAGIRSLVIRGVLLGILFSVALLFVQYMLDDRPQTPEDIMNCAGIPTLSILPAARKPGKREKNGKTPPGEQGGST